MRLLFAKAFEALQAFRSAAEHSQDMSSQVPQQGGEELLALSSRKEEVSALGQSHVWRVPQLMPSPPNFCLQDVIVRDLVIGASVKATLEPASMKRRTQ